MSTLVAQTISNGTVSTSSANVIQGSAKAWVNFAPNNPAVTNASYNVSSVTRTGTGAFTITFTNALTDGNYCAALGIRGAPVSISYAQEDVNTIVRTSTQLAVYSAGAGTALTDANTNYSVAIFR
jgi:hypothetical protein